MQEFWISYAGFAVLWFLGFSQLIHGAEGGIAFWLCVTAVVCACCTRWIRKIRWKSTTAILCIVVSQLFVVFVLTRLLN